MSTDARWNVTDTLDQLRGQHGRLAAYDAIERSLASMTAENRKLVGALKSIVAVGSDVLPVGTEDGPDTLPGSGVDTVQVN